jgi:ornithine cyclodeaminase
MKTYRGMQKSSKILHKMLLLSESNVRQCLSIETCLAANRQALASIVTKEANVPTRIGMQYKTASHDNATDWTLIKPASLELLSETALMGLKVVSVRSENSKTGHPLVQATVLNIDPATGQVDAVVAGTYLTAARTAAGSALATKLFQPDLQRLVVFGAGLQAELHIHAISVALGRPIPHTTIINRTKARATQLQQSLPTTWTRETSILLMEDAIGIAKACQAADCVCTTTNSATPILDATLLKRGCHVNGIGSYTPDTAEVCCVERCLVIMDTLEAKEVGDLNDLTAGHPVKLLGEFLVDETLRDQWLKQSLTKKMDCTFYKSVGTAIQDVLTVNEVVKKARHLGIGTEFDMS